MKKSIKFKISMLYVSLIVIMSILGIASLMNMYKIRQSVTNLITTNYNSIERITSMREALDAQNLEVMLYIYEGDIKNHRDIFDTLDRRFSDNYNEEYKTLVIPAEIDIINNISNCYDDFRESFNELIALQTDGVLELERKKEYYESNIYPAYERTKDALKDLLESNEKALFARRDEASFVIQNSIKILIFIFSITGVISYFTARFYTNKLLKPIYEVTENIKSIRQGNMDRKTTVKSIDELGELCLEFNNMTQRLSEFEKSTMGSLMEEKNRTFAIMRSINEPMVILDENSSVTIMNRSFEKLFSTTIEKSKGKHFLEVISESGRLKELSGVNYKLKKLNDFTEQIISLKENGKVKYYNVMVTPFSYQNDDNKPSVIIVFYDITGMKEIEKMRIDFIATVSHEFKTPLTSILMGADLLSIVSDNINNEQKEIISTIKEDSQRLCNLVNNLLEVSKVESTDEIYNFSYCNMGSIIEKALKNFKNIARNKNVSVITHIEEDMPDILVDEEKIVWVMNNLISNALKYTKEEDTITIKSYFKDGYITTSVSDTGVGIPEEFIDKVFEKYVQVSDCDIEARGTGIGLSASKVIINAHKGHIWCESSIKNGSTFTFVIPINSVDEGDFL